MSSLEFVAYATTRDTLKRMADEGIFVAIGDVDTLPGICSEAVIARFRPAIMPERGGGDQGESNIPLPGIIITWAGHNRPETAGENDLDDGVITMIIQIVDRLDRSEDDNIESYFRWMTDIREHLQRNPYRSLCQRLGDIYLAHMTDSVEPENRHFLMDEARLVSTLKLFTRSRRDTGVVNYDA